MIELTLPWPPSVNHYWRYVPKLHGAIISREGREYRKMVAQIAAESGAETQVGALYVKRVLYCPDWRERDEDNTAKAIYDSLAAAKVIAGDEFVCLSTCEKRKARMERAGLSSR